MENYIWMLYLIQLIANVVILKIVLNMKTDSDKISENISKIISDDIDKLTNNISQHIPTPPTSKPSPVDKDYFLNGFNTSKNYFWSSLQLIYFDMYLNSEILDYETQVKEISTRLNKLLESPEYKNELIDKLDKYFDQRDNSQFNY